MTRESKSLSWWVLVIAAGGFWASGLCDPVSVSHGLARADEREITADEETEQRKKEMAAMAAKVRIRWADPARADATITRLEEPVLDFTDATRDEYGTLWLWVSEGQPVVIAEVWTQWADQHRWGYTMSAIAKEPLVGQIGAGNFWNSQRPGVEFRPIPAAPAPATNAAARLAQMRNQARRFAARSRSRDNVELRLLPQPVYRYSPHSDQQDGAIFCFVHGNTNPEAILLIELIDGQWQHAFGRCTLDPLFFNLDGKEIWYDPTNNGRNPNSPFFLCFDFYYPEDE